VYAGNDNERAERIAQACQAGAEELLDFVAEAVSIPSVTGSEQAITQRFTRWFEDNGFAVEQRHLTPDFVAAHPNLAAGEQLDERPNVHGFWGDREQPGLILNGHLDVVTPGAIETWARPPFGATREQGRIYGRGAADMKAGVVAALFAVRALREAGIEPACPVELQCVIAEEIGGLGTLYALESAPHPARAAIVMEPTDCVVAAAGGGVLMFAVEVDGRSTHTSSPWAGESALEKLLIVHEALRQLHKGREAKLHHPLFAALPAQAPFAIGTAEVGEWLATVPDRGRMAGRFGLLPGESVAEARGMLERCVAKAAGSDEWLREHPPAITWLTPGGAAWESPLDDPVVVAMDAASRELDPAAQLGAVTYGSDANHFAARGVPTVVFGPGRISDAHVKDEYVEERSVLKAAHVLALSLDRYFALVAEGKHGGSA
jgi:acetylornithine deacetylase